MKSYDLSTEELRAVLAPKRKPYWYHIRTNEHLGITVLTTGKRWVVRYRNKGNEYTTRTIGAVGSDGDGLSFKQAMEAAERLIKKMKAGGDVKSPVIYKYKGQLTICPIGDVYTVGHAIHEYIEWKRIAATPATFESALALVNYHVIPRISHIPLAEFNGKHFYDFCLDMLETPPKYGHLPVGLKIKLQDMNEEALRKRKKTLNTLVSALRVAFTLAWERGDLESDMPIRCLRRLPNYDSPRALFLSRKECRALLKCCDKPIQDLILGALYTGCRVMELVNLRVADVAKDGFGLFVTRTKNYKARFVYLPDEGMAFFLKMIDGKSDDELVFTSAKGKHWGRQYHYPFRKAVTKACLPKEIVFHSLRHTYASQLIQAGSSMGSVAKQLGHANTNAVDQTYGHLVPGIAGVEIQRHFSKLDVTQVHSKKTLQKVARLKKQFAKLAPPKLTQESSWPRSNFSLHQSALLADIAPSSRRFRAT
jgi:integrase